MGNEVETIIIVLGIAAGCVIFALAFRLLHIRSKIREMEEILTEIREGNGNRKLLIRPGEPIAPIAYQINQIVSGYEERLAATLRNEEMNRQLMTSLSHDVRTPLTILIGYLDAVCRGSVREEERDGYIRTAQRKAHDLKAYIDTLFDWFKLNSDEFPLEIKAAEITEFTREVLKDWIPVLEEYGFDFDISIPETAFVANLDTDAYRRIVNNLMQNVIVHSRADHVGVLLEKDGQNISGCVSDNGVGISQSDLVHIFDRLYKCDMGRSEKGSGLGLSIAKQLVEKMGGVISADSRPNEQTRFTVKFPLDGAA